MNNMGILSRKGAEASYKILLGMSCNSIYVQEHMDTVEEAVGYLGQALENDNMRYGRPHTKVLLPKNKMYFIYKIFVEILTEDLSPKQAMTLYSVEVEQSLECLGRALSDTNQITFGIDFIKKSIAKYNEEMARYMPKLRDNSLDAVREYEQYNKNKGKALVWKTLLNQANSPKNANIGYLTIFQVTVYISIKKLDMEMDELRQQLNVKYTNKAYYKLIQLEGAKTVWEQINTWICAQ